jgi:hypothetical protein
MGARACERMQPRELLCCLWWMALRLSERLGLAPLRAVACRPVPHVEACCDCSLRQIGCHTRQQPSTAAGHQLLNGVERVVSDSERVLHLALNAARRTRG